MSLWTPYAEDLPLDLTMSSAKENIVSSDLSGYGQSTIYGFSHLQAACLQVGHPSLQVGHPSLQVGHPSLQVGHPSLQVGHPSVYAAYSSPQTNYTVPTEQMSPSTSGGSTCSYDASVPAIPSSPHFIVRANTLSPPESPVTRNAKGGLDMDLDVLSDDPDFQAFEQNALRAMAEKNGGALLGNNPRMRRAVKSTNQDSTDDSYRQQRQRNNFAAKQSRDRRKLREIHLALKVSYLKNTVASLKAKLAARPLCGRCRQSCEG